MKEINYRIVVSLIIIFLSFAGNKQFFCKTKSIKNIKNENLASSKMKKAPYLIYNGVNTEYIVLWQLSESKKTLLRWGTDTTYSVNSVETTEYNDSHQHKYTLTNLTPGAKYYYQVKVDLEVYKGNFSAAPEDDVDAVKFIAYGDTRIEDQDESKSHNAVTKQILKLFNSDPEYQSIVLFPGDVVKRGGEEDLWDFFFDSQYGNSRELRSRIGYQIAVGNHEDVQSSTTHKPGIINKYFPYHYKDDRYWAFDYGPARIFILDQYSSSYSSQSKAQLKWLDKELKATNKKWKIVVMHQVGYTYGHHENSSKTIENILPICKDNGVKLMIGGHNHLYARALVDGVNCITTGGGGSSITHDTQGGDHIEKVVLKHHFCKINIDKDNLFFEAVDDSGKTIDSFTISLEQNLYELKTNIVGLGKIDITPDSNYYHTETDIILRAVPQDGWSFENWEGDLTGSVNPTNITLDRNKEIGAVFSNPNGGTINIQIKGKADDAEEKLETGNVSIKSSDLEFVVDGLEQIVGMRFNNIKIPKGAKITKAHIQLTADETDKGSCNLKIQGEESDNADTFSTLKKNISNRKKTSAFVLWEPAAWKIVGESGDKQKSPDLTTIVQEIVNRNGWNLGNSLVILVTGSGTRTAKSYNGSAKDAAKLYVEYSNVTSVEKKEEEIIPSEYEFVSYPNPFNPSTKIEFRLQNAGQVKITIYNLLGKEVSKVVDDYFQRGDHSFVWDTKMNNNNTLPSGVYIARIEVDNYIKNIKMVLLK